MPEDRERNLALTAWLGGFAGGPFVAVAILASGRHKETGWSRGYTKVAAVFWALLVAGYVSVFLWDVLRRPDGFGGWDPGGVFLVAWAGYFVVAVTACAAATLSILRKTRASDS